MVLPEPEPFLSLLAVSIGENQWQGSELSEKSGFYSLTFGVLVSGSRSDKPWKLRSGNASKLCIEVFTGSG